MTADPGNVTCGRESSFTFTIKFNFNPPETFEDYWELQRWLEAAEESSDEFARELNEWLNKHPLIEGCLMKKK
jgi:hypothetical protein